LEKSREKPFKGFPVFRVRVLYLPLGWCGSESSPGGEILTSQFFKEYYYLC
jgi:hypothetical protein